jgi:hypothetical protein
MDRVLSTEEQIQKLEPAMHLANEASKSTDIDRRLGAFLLYAGMVDFLAIQAARLVEQIILKAQIAEGKKPAFQTHPDTFFFDRRISTRRILKGIRKFLPFKSLDPSANEGKRITDLANQMIDIGFEFLNYRNPIIHHIGNPTKTFEDIIALCDRANKVFHKFCKAHKDFFEAASPYRFSKKELEYFCGQGNR